MEVYENGALWLFGSVGRFQPRADDGDFTSGEVRSALAAHGRDKPVTVYINSYGGLGAEGVAIHNALKSHGGRVTVIIDGIAASAASLIAMAGAEIVMRRGSTMMIHDPSSVTEGTAAEHTKTLSGLNALANEMAAIYAGRSGRPLDKVRELMVAETWMTGDEAVKLGFADRVDAIDGRAVAAFNYDKVYSHAPAHVLSQMRQAKAKAILQNVVQRASAHALGKPVAREPSTSRLGQILAGNSARYKRG